ncbi:hypothetical protein ANTPLA_LOCUS4356 [Anthophora plagiata]
MASENSVNVLRDLIRKRATVKSKLTTFMKYVESHQDSEEIHVNQLKIRIAKLEKEFETFELVQEALELAASDDDYEIRLGERTEFENLYYKALTIAKLVVKQQEKADGQVDGPTQSVAEIVQSQTTQYGIQPSGLTDGTNVSSPLTIPTESYVKLPTMQLPSFSGSYEAWPGFSDAFKSAIHDNPTFREVQKLIYLKSCLTGRAAEKIESLETTAANYEVAWNILEKYYNDPSIVINNRIQAFFELPVCSRSNLAALGELTDLATKHYNALTALKTPFLESFPIYAITSKLDEQTRLRWKEKTQGAALPSMEELLEFLHNRRRVLETTKIESSKPITRSFANPNMRNRGLSNANGHTLAHSIQQARCSLCKRNHFIQHCSKLINATSEQRTEMVKKVGLCTNCLRPNHDLKDCNAGSCRRCNGKHHTLLHKEEPPIQVNVSALHVSNGDETLLSTAVVHIYDNKGRSQPCRVLLDSGSQSHFITERLARKLGLPRQKTNIPVVGINSTASYITNSLRAKIKSRINNFCTDLTFLILPQITEILPSRPISKSHLNIPSNIPLADPGFHIPSEIDALIGAEVFFKLLCVGQLSIANGTITIQKTKIGWILAGKSPAEHPVKSTRCHVTRKGPSWLSLEESHWPFSPLLPAEIPELRAIVALPAQVEPGLFERFSSFHRLKRVVTYMLRFSRNCSKGEPSGGPLTTTELYNAETRIVKLVQRQSFQNEIHELKTTKHIHKLSSLTPFLDADGILRVGGRLSNANLPYGKKHPILLHKSHHVTKLIVRDEHLKNLHAGIQATLNAVRRTFWIPHGKVLVRQIIHECITCRRAQPTTVNYLMGNLPAARVNYSRPFLQSGVDFCGPFFIKERFHRNRGKIKVYLAIFVCFSTRAVHIEIVTDLSTDAFLAALRRFFSRRGKCSDLFSDNATNFIGAKREISEVFAFLSNATHKKIIAESLANQHIRWHLIPPRSPHFGGLWEAAVKSAKHHMVRVLGDTLLSFEAFLTFTTQIEAVLNSRPLTPLSSDPNDLNAITPGHFLIGESLMSIPDHDFTNVPDGRLSSWQHVQKLRQHFWNRWRKEYLQELVVRKKWHSGAPQQLHIGTMVVVQEDNLPPMQWPLGRIVAVHPGTDGIIRVVTVKTSRGEYKRSVKRIAPLPVERS